MNEGRKYEKLGYENLGKNDLKEAESCFLQALKLMETSGDETGQAYVLGNLGNICFQDKRLDLAEDYYSKSLTLMEQVKDTKGIESSLGNLGSVFFTRGSLDKAEENKAFAESLGAKHTVLSDPTGAAGRANGVVAFGGLYARRWTFYIDSEGLIREVDKNVRVDHAGQDIAAQLDRLGFPKLAARATGP